MENVVAVLDALPEWLATTLEFGFAVALWGLVLALLVVVSSLTVF